MTIFEVLQKELDGRIQMVLDNLGRGAASDYAEYRYHCGVLYGLYATKAYVAELKSNLEGEE